MPTTAELAPTERDDRPSAPEAEGGRLDGLRPVATAQKIGIGTSLVVLCIAASVLSDDFFTSGNAVNIARPVALIGIVSIGQTVDLLTGGIDLSVGAVVSDAGVVLVK